jgi:HK97 family phage major capsid protein
MAASTSSADELTTEQVQKILVQPLETASVFLSSAPRVFDTDGSPVRVPSLAGMDAPAWHGENEQIGEVEAEFGEITLLPSTVKSLKSLTRFSNELARQTVVALDSALQDRMVKDIAATLDSAFIAGTGTVVSGNRTTPLGLINQTGIQVVDAAPTTLDPLIDAWGSLLGVGANADSAKWLMNPADFVALRKIKQGTGSNGYVLTPDPTNGSVFRLFGAEVKVSTHVPAGSAVLADFSQIGVARDQAPSVKILDQTFGQYDQMAIRVTARYDAAPLNPEAVVLVAVQDEQGD